MKINLTFSLFLLLSSTILLASCTTAGTPPSTLPPTQRPYVINSIKYYPISSSAGYIETGTASWYGPDFHGKSTSNGERYNMYGKTAAHKILPMNTILHVKNLENGREEVVRINDRGPFVRGRIIDLSYTTAKKLGILKKGTARVRITALAPASKDGSTLQIPEFGKGKFYVQIGSFTIEDNALRLKKRFVDAGHPCVITKYKAKSTVYFRVQVYVGEYLKTAKKAEKALLDRGYRGAFIIAH